MKDFEFVKPSSEVADSMTVIVPTYNRSEFLHRMLHFMEATQLPFRVLIADSSGQAERRCNERLVERFHHQLRLDYFHTDQNFIQKCVSALRLTTSPYVAFHADDDFGFWRSHIRLVDFLESNPEYTSAQGQVIAASNASQQNANCFSCERIPMHDVIDDNPVDRMFSYVKYAFSTFYAVHRTTTARSAFEVTALNTDFDASRGFPEGMLLLLTVIYGKLKTLPETHYIQVTHGANCTYTVPKIADKSRTSEFKQRFCAAIATELTKMSAIEFDEAENLASEFLHVVPGVHKRKPGSRRSIVKSIRREVTRVYKRVAKLTQKRQTQTVGITIQNRSTLPATPDYDLAIDLLTEYPTGIPLDVARVRAAA